MGEVITVNPGSDEDEEVEATHMQAPMENIEVTRTLCAQIGELRHDIRRD